MSLITEELSIVTVKELLNLNLEVPGYQRPYNWSTNSTNTLFTDTYEAYKEGIDEYRLGSVILHKTKDKYYIVDGQQRTTTLSILLYCLGEKNNNNGLLNKNYSSLSTNSIINNFQILDNKVSELKDDEKLRYKAYLLNKCTIVKIVTDEEQEAFQFFDSQNSRGKELAPHDLLKSYHLREMNNEKESLKIKIINEWENKNQSELEILFKDYLFPLTRWYKWRNGLGYSSEEISSFKGIKNTNVYNYAIYQKASNLFIEQMNRNGSIELLASNELNQFQLTQPLIAGRRYFEYTLYYSDLLEKIQKKISDFSSKNSIDGNKEMLIPSKKSGDKYIKRLYECALLFFADRFGINSITDSVMKQLYTWSYSLRLVMVAVYPETINKYALGRHERVNSGIDIFAKISEMIEPEELNLIILDKLNNEQVGDRLKNYNEIWEFLKKENRWK